ncbi:MAG: hypothetical protein ACK5RG_07625 [Cyclobacteriaceae bacterium]|jgi:hypothetical protein|nr:hypothetical protein [Flammeovirgaceae bacterium]
MFRFLVLAVCVASVSGVFAQQSKLEIYFNQVRAGKYPSIPTEITKPENASNALSVLNGYLNDSIVFVRQRAASVSRYIGTQSKVNAVRTKAVDQLVMAAKDKDNGNVGAALLYLTEFKKKDFTKSNQDTLYSIFKRKQAHLNILIRLMGYLEIQTSKNDLYNLSQDQSLGRKDRWTAMLALARMNDEQAITDVLNRVKRMPLTDAVVYDIFPDLVFTRRPEAISFLVEAIYSDAKNCESPNSDNAERIPCAYRIMEMLAPVIENYPLKQNASGDIETTDYTGALQQVRNWFKSYTNYSILRDTY